MRSYLEEIGIDFEVIDRRTLQPLHEATLLAPVAKTRRPAIVHEARVTGGYEAEVAAVFTDEAFSGLKAPMKGMGAVETPAPLSRVLEREYLPSASKIVDAVKGVMKWDDTLCRSGVQETTGSIKNQQWDRTA